MHMLGMLKMSRVYTLAAILSKIIVKKKQRKIGDPIYDRGLTNKRFGAILNFIKIYYAITACTTYTFTFVKCLLIEKL